jgi:hypothetical protein
MSIVGLTDFELIRDFLYSRMRGAAAADAPDVAPADPTFELLSELLSEVRRLRVGLLHEPDDKDSRRDVPAG